MDNVPYMQSALSEKGHSKRNKHVLIRMKIVNEAITNDEITLEHLTTSDMVADILTKPLGPIDFHRLRRIFLVWIQLEFLVPISVIPSYIVTFSDSFDFSHIFLLLSKNPGDVPETGNLNIIWQYM